MHTYVHIHHSTIHALGAAFLKPIVCISKQFAVQHFDDSYQSPLWATLERARAACTALPSSL
jgi:hypothetical protein